ncbi:ribosomal protein S18-alanine N-acetyltransferase [Bacillus solimangrovi]|uniref:[Ribosomal protein bS18]-alanine N-acetyltransferase n=1 Tax=Bacillus solimangrovi TaxID=1305675 RepID=A0A1E5LCA1_9BACI|nr:ribosomal protein S18-alanine N-acetyltransferase [Bacillus solimangrovi]OEH91725.1 ribosomal-protein-alanine N-acetyltransferase [Bacillus solimangrovi]
MGEYEIKYRLMNEHDIEDVLRIEKSSFATPWTYEAFYNEVVHNQFARYLLIIKGEEVIGYCGLWIVFDDASVTNVAILPKERGNRYGEMLMHQAMEFARAVGGLRLSLEVRTSNHIAQNLYRKLGFESGGIRKNYYADNQEDALVMWVNL